MAMKLDMYKAYDRIGWTFVGKMLTALGFPKKWVYLIMSCTTTVSYSIQINGQPKGNIIPTRGLRQGDPLSPYLFNLCVEALSSILHTARNKNILQGIRMTPQCPTISHLFFAYDAF